MCLKEYEIMTFSNRDAFERMLQKIEDPKYLKTTPTGKIKVVKEFFGKGWQQMPKDWDRYSYEEIKSMEFVGHWFRVHHYQFWDWQSFKKVVEEVKDKKFIYGEIRIEIR